MSRNEWIQVVGWTAVTFAVSVLFDMMFKYRLQLVYSASHAGSLSWEPSPLTRPALRHLLVFVLASLGVYIYRTGIAEPSASVIIWFALLAVYGMLLLRDSVRDLKQRGAE